MHYLSKVLTILTLLIGTTACNKPVVAVHPGAISNVDSYSYDILIVEQDVLATARAQYAAGTLPKSAETYLKAAIAEYNVAQAAWHAYHDQHAANSTALQDAINALVAGVSELQQVLGKAPAPVPAASLDWLAGGAVWA